MDVDVLYFFFNEKGVILKIKRKYFGYKIFTGLINIIPYKIIKHTFAPILILSKLLFNFIKNIKIFENKKNSLIYTLTLYMLLYKYHCFNFFSFFQEKKLKIRRSNRFLRGFKYWNKKVTSILDKMVNVVYSKLLLKNSYTEYLFNIFFDKNIYMFANNEQMFSAISKIVKKYPISLKIWIFKELFYRQLTYYMYFKDSLKNMFDIYLYNLSKLYFNKIKLYFNHNILFYDFSENNLIIKNHLTLLTLIESNNTTKSLGVSNEFIKEGVSYKKYNFGFFFNMMFKSKKRKNIIKFN